MLDVRALLRVSDSCWGEVDLATRRARLFPPPAPMHRGHDLYSMLTVAAAVLLGRQGCALIHAAAVVDPSGGACLLVGDSHSGKSTTTVNLITRGWNYLSDDQVILVRSEGGLEVFGLLRPFHLDEGWSDGNPASRRGTVDATSIGPGQPARRAPLGRVLLPRVDAAQPTAIASASAAEVLENIVRQSPWLLADPVGAPAILDLLGEAARTGGARLSLGLDTFSDAGRLERVLLSPGP